MGFVKAASTNEIEDGKGKAVEISGIKIALFKLGGEFFAIDNTCPHKGGPLCEGEIEDCVVTCPWHGWKFDVKTGVSPVVPTAKVTKYNTKVEGNDVLVETGE